MPFEAVGGGGVYFPRRKQQIARYLKATFHESASPQAHLISRLRVPPGGHKHSWKSHKRCDNKGYQLSSRRKGNHDSGARVLFGGRMESEMMLKVIMISPRWWSRRLSPYEYLLDGAGGPLAGAQIERRVWRLLRQERDPVAPQKYTQTHASES